MASNDDEFARALKDELERRIAELGSYGESEFGGWLSGKEVAIALIGCALIPILIVWAFA